jgi:hypothetical protein
MFGPGNNVVVIEAVKEEIDDLVEADYKDNLRVAEQRPGRRQLPVTSRRPAEILEEPREPDTCLRIRNFRPKP